MLSYVPTFEHFKWYCSTEDLQSLPGDGEYIIRVHSKNPNISEGVKFVISKVVKRMYLPGARTDNLAR